MTENQNQTQKTEQPKEKEIKITVDNEQTKILAEQLAKAEASKKEMQEKLEKIEADNKVQAEASKKAQEETEDLKNKLGMIAEVELNKKRKSVTEKANALLKDPERVKEIESKLSTPDGVAAMEYTMNVLEKQMKIGEEQYKASQEADRKKAEEVAATQKKAEEEAAKVAAEAEKSGKPQPKPETPAGSAPMNSAQMGSGGEPTDMMHMKFGSYEAMVRYLHEVENGPDKEKAAEAKAALTSLLQKWASLVKQKYDAMQGAPTKGFENAPQFKDMLLSKRAQEELKRRQQGNQPESVT
jgi:hypothetical protein